MLAMWHKENDRIDLHEWRLNPFTLIMLILEAGWGGTTLKNGFLTKYFLLTWLGIEEVKRPAFYMVIFHYEGVAICLMWVAQLRSHKWLMGGGFGGRSEVSVRGQGSRWPLPGLTIVVCMDQHSYLTSICTPQTCQPYFTCTFMSLT